MSVRFPTLSSYHDDSLRPPPESGDGEDDASWDCGEALIDPVAYMIDERNHTSARCPFVTTAGKPEELQVTFRLAPPPHVSHFCVAYASGERTRFISEPLVLATEGNLALVSVKQGMSWLAESTDYNFFVYHAPIGGHGHGGSPPRLRALPHPDPGFFPRVKYCYFTQGETGILRYRTTGSKDSPFVPCAGDEEFDEYKIATFYTRVEESGATHYDLYVYDSRTDAWTRSPTVFEQEQPAEMFSSDRVITVGGTMVWVDLSQGMILCDLLHAPPEESAGGRRQQLRYIRLPRPVQPRVGFPLCVSTSSFSRDIAAVDGRIKFVDLEIHVTSPGLSHWTAVTWSMAVGDSEFHRDGEVKSADIASGALKDHRSFFVAHPTLSSRHGDILYLMAKPRLALRERESSVIAVDMRNRKMERVAKYTTQRFGSMDFAYMLTTISKYLAPAGDLKANM